MNLETIQNYIADRIDEEIKKRDDQIELKELIRHQLVLLRNDPTIWFDHMRLFANTMLDDENGLNHIKELLAAYSEKESVQMMYMAKEQRDLRKQYGETYFEGVRIIIEIDSEARLLYERDKEAIC